MRSAYHSRNPQGRQWRLFAENTAHHFPGVVDGIYRSLPFARWLSRRIGSARVAEYPAIHATLGLRPPAPWIPNRLGLPSGFCCESFRTQQQELSGVCRAILPVGDDGTRRETLTRRAILARACNHHGGAFNSDAGGTNGTLGSSGISPNPPRNVPLKPNTTKQPALQCM